METFGQTNEHCKLFMIFTKTRSQFMLKCYNSGTDIILKKKEIKNIDSRKIKNNVIKNDNPN